MHTRRPSLVGLAATIDDPNVPQTPLTPGAGLMGRLKSFGKAGTGVKRTGVIGEIPVSPMIGPSSVPEVCEID